MGILLCEQNFRDVWIRNKSVRAEIGQILRTHTQTHTHTTAAKLVVRMIKTPPTAKAVMLLFDSTASDRPVAPRRQVCLFGVILRESLHRWRLTPERRDK